MPGLPVVIPDMVYFEVTQNFAKLGVGEIVEWARKHHGQVEIAPTTVFAEFQTLRATNPRTRSKGRGEAAALEGDEEARAVLREHLTRRSDRSGPKH